MARNGHRLPFLRVLPDARAEDHRPGEGGDASDHVHDRRAREVHVAVAEPEVGAELREPAAAPDPVRKERIGEHRDEEAVDEERRPLPALGHRAGGDRAGGVHEHHLEQEQREHAHVVHVRAQEEALGAEEAERMAEERDHELAVERRRAPEHGHRAHTAHLQGEAADPVAEHADGIDHEVHRHRVGGVLGPAEAGLHEREPRLHEHDQEAGQQRPHQVDGDLAVAHGGHHLVQLRGLGILDRDVGGGTRVVAGGIGRSRHRGGGGRRRRGRRRRGGRGLDGGRGRLGAGNGAQPGHAEHQHRADSEAHEQTSSESHAHFLSSAARAPVRRARRSGCGPRPRATTRTPCRLRISRSWRS